MLLMHLPNPSAPDMPFRIVGRTHQGSAFHKSETPLQPFLPVKCKCHRADVFPHLHPAGKAMLDALCFCLFFPSRCAHPVQKYKNKNNKGYEYPKNVWPVFYGNKMDQFITSVNYVDNYVVIYVVIYVAIVNRINCYKDYMLNNA